MATIAQAEQVKQTYQGQLLALPYVGGVATSVLDGEPVLMVLLNRTPTATEPVIPTYLDGVRLVTRNVGLFRTQ
jgi:hypothetical protein